MPIDGPFAESKELIAGFWIFDLKSKAEAVEWVRRAPIQEGELEIRRVFEAEYFGDALPEHIKEWEAQERARQEARQSRRHLSGMPVGRPWGRPTGIAGPGL